MHVLFITYSLTGNTAFVAESIGKILREQFGHSVTFIDALKIIKAAKLGSNKKPISENRDLDCKELQDLRAQLAQADVLGLGCFVSCHLPQIGLEEIFDTSVLSAEIFSNIKFFFTYTTHGSVPHPVGDVLATIINNRTEQASYLGHLNIRTPENIISYLPPINYHDAWDDVELAKIDPFGMSVGEALKDPNNIKSISFNKIAHIDYSMQFSIVGRTGPPQVDESKCVKCRTCVNLCPYNVIKIGSKGFPEWDADSCLVCCRCYNQCPNEAIDFPKVFGAFRSRYSKPDFTKVGVGDGKNEKGQIMIPLPLPQEIFARRGWKP